MSGLKVGLFAAAWQRILAELNVSAPEVRFLTATNDTTRGYYEPAYGRITVFLHPDVTSQGYVEAGRKLTAVLRHELRHHYQNEHWETMANDKPGSYWFDRKEEDAREFAEQIGERLVSVKPGGRPAAQSGFSKMQQRAGRGT